MKITIHHGKFGKLQLKVKNLFNKIYDYKMEKLIPNLCTSLQIFLMIPTTAEHSISLN